MRVDQILSRYNALHEQLVEAKDRLKCHIEQFLRDAGLKVSFVSARLKDRARLEENFERKKRAGKEYKTLSDVTDIVGVRIVTYYLEDAGRAAKIIRDRFQCNWGDSEDKRDRLKVEQFG